MRRQKTGRFTSAIVLLLVASSAAGSEPQQRPEHVREPWEVSWEERMALRFGAAERERREAAHVRAGGNSQPPGMTVIVGATDAAAITPSELFDNLFATAFALDARARSFWRQSVERKLGPAMPVDFWSRLERAAAPYLRLFERDWQLLREYSAAAPSERPAIQSQQAPGLTFCRTAAASLAAARREFGAEVFDAVLYQGMAPSLTIFTTSNQAELERSEAGCQ